jgi:hypothetical protein
MILLLIAEDWILIPVDGLLVIEGYFFNYIWSYIFPIFC